MQQIVWIWGYLVTKKSLGVNTKPHNYLNFDVAGPLGWRNENKTTYFITKQNHLKDFFPQTL